MNLVATLASLLLAVLVAAAAVRKLTHHPRVVQSYSRVGVPESMLNYLAAILLAAAAGLVMGTWWRPMGVASAAGLVAYFSVAVVAHVRAGDTARLATPVAYGLLATAVVMLKLAVG